MKTKLLFLLLVTAIIGNQSCKKDKDNDPDVCSNNWVTSTQDELTTVTNAAMAYGTNPTVANCNAYKTAYQAYINVLKNYENCSSLTGINRTEWKNSLDEAQEQLTEFTCQ